jgi:UDP-N-acetylglucosamine diphosphorylase / glucose-1-phosphate thymidylyltransferase / UDP-N-acetylgalactosamine diphosphorylase / glucosamine-1-phosphate N-acetyltransferase / galactosamine-1-phosphate N-acetyltransferase
MLNASYYFDLEGFSDLLEESSPVWEALKKLPEYLKSQNLGKIETLIPEGVFLENPESISIGKGSVIEPGVYIKGPVLIGKNCKVLHGAYIRENVILGDGAVVGHSSEVKNSILLPGAHAAHFNYVGDSILGRNSNLGAGVKCANMKFDKKSVSVEIDQKKIDTGLRKLGLILGDTSQVGCNAVTSPGTLIGKKVFCYPCSHIRGSIPSKARVKTK